MKKIKGFKVFNPDWTCRGFQYEVGQTYEEEVVPSVCNSGFHFCKQAKDCFNYYIFDPDNKVAEVVALGEVSEEGDKCSTNKIQIVREIPWSELLTLVNIGKGNVGLCNSGDWNSGDWNSGDCNSGNRNSGDWNSGDWNSGDWNSGNRNSGDWNKTSFVAGCFNTEQHKLKFFDQETDMTFDQWRMSNAYHLLNHIDFRPTEWICLKDMTDEEKEQYPTSKATGGYLKKRDNTDACIKWWNRLSEIERNVIKAIPNFNSDKFLEITGIRA